jgi:hypothetical protein
VDNISGKSYLSPGSYSIVVTVVVEPETKTVTSPFFILLSFIAYDVLSVMSIISVSPLDFI